MLPQARPTPRNRQLVLPAIVITAIIALVFFAGPHEAPPGGPAPNNQRQELDVQLRSPGGSGPNRRVINELETMWQVPPGPKAVLIVLHGCAHQGTDFWPHSQECPQCLGLPEEMLIRQIALVHSYAVIAPSSFNRERKCWHMQFEDPSQSNDGLRVPGIIETIVKEEGLEGLPLYAVGISSGGGFALMLPHLLPIQGLCAQITPAPTSLLKLKSGKPYPPTLFVDMAQRDPEKHESVVEAMAFLEEAGTPTEEIQVVPRVVNDALLRHSYQIDDKLSKLIKVALKDGGILDASGYVGKNPRSTTEDWQPLLEKVVKGKFSLQADESPIFELLNVAWARHEGTSDSAVVMLKWFEAGGKKSVAQLQEELQAALSGQ